MASGIFFQFDARDNTVVVLPTLGTILVLPFARVALLKLKWQGARVILPNCACHLAQTGPDLYSKCSCPRTIYNFGTASYQLPSSKLILNGVVHRSEVARL